MWLGFFSCAKKSKTSDTIVSLLFFYVFLQPISNADFIVPVEIDGTVHQVMPLLYIELHM